MRVEDGNMRERTGSNAHIWGYNDQYDDSEDD